MGASKTKASQQPVGASALSIIKQNIAKDIGDAQLRRGYRYQPTRVCKTHERGCFDTKLAFLKCTQAFDLKCGSAQIRSKVT